MNDGEWQDTIFAATQGTQLMTRAVVFAYHEALCKIFEAYRTHIAEAGYLVD